MKPSLVLLLLLAIVKTKTDEHVPNGSSAIPTECVLQPSWSVGAGFHPMFSFNTSTCTLSKTIEIEKDYVQIVGMPTEVKCTSAAGIQASQVTNFVMKNVSIYGCGLENKIKIQDGITYYMRAAVIIKNCTNVTLQDVSLVQSNGTGLVMLSTGGTVLIKDCTFEDNSLNNNSISDLAVLSGGSGLYIELPYCGIRPKNKFYLDFCNDNENKEVKKISGSKYHIRGCSFLRNFNNNLKPNRHSDYYTGLGAGGGAAIVVGRDSEDNSFLVEDCQFRNNDGALGGGLYIALQDNANATKITFQNTTFEENACTRSVGLGGGVSAGFLFESSKKVSNSIQFIDCVFTHNKAKYGGGGSFYFSKSLHTTNSIELLRCNWTQNLANFGAAMKISPHLYASDSADTSINFTVSNNFISSNNFNSSKKVRGRATVLAETCKVKFLSVNIFENNTGSALCLDSSEAEFVNGSHVTFSGNKGFQGGAIALTGYSILKFGDNSRFLFQDNQAQDGGGAIFQLALSTRDIQISRTCFIQYSGDTQKMIKDYNTSFIFKNNSGTPRGRRSEQLSRFGHSILVTSICPCHRSTAKCSQLPLNKTLECIGNFTFVHRNSHDLSSFEKTVTIPEKHIYVVPGKLTQLNLTSMDDFSNEAAAIYHMSLKHNGSKSTVISDSKFTYVSDNIKLYGQPGQNVTLYLESTTVRHITLEVEATIQECPPGFLNRNDKVLDRLECTCFPEISSSYSGIRFCSNSKSRAYIMHGYWIGYDSNATFAQEKDLVFSYCHFGRCSSSERCSSSGRCLSNNSGFTVLPINTNTTELNLIICGTHRTGVFCSKCQPNSFMRYHSRTFTCRPSKDECRLGWLYYAVSEIIPVTVFFVVLMVFDLRLTSSSVNGLVLFMQLSDSLQISGTNIIPFPSATKTLLQIFFVFTGVFNLDFLELEELSYCLWPNAKTSDLLAMKYLTVAYAFGLVVAMILFLKYCNAKVFVALRRKTSSVFPVRRHSPVIHGLTGFLIICYSEATKVSLILLTPAKLYSVGRDNIVHSHSTVSSCDGDLLFFRGNHLAYAIPALLVLVVLGLLPPLLLLSYPLCYKVFGLLKISESRFIKVLCLLIPLEKAKPFFDSFQNGLKDDCRFFAGLYFVYRLMTVATFALVSQSLMYFSLIALELLLMLTLHGIFQPLKKRRHNVVDGLLYGNLLAISLLTVLNCFLTFYYVNGQKYINISTSFQALLLYLPFLYASINVLIKLKNTRKCRKDSEELNYVTFSSSLDIVEDRCKEIEKF